MILLVIEIRRLLRRRLVKWLTVLAVFGSLLAGTITFLTSENEPSAVAAAERRRNTAVTQCITQVENGTWGEGDVPGRATADPKGFCEDETWVEDPRFRFEEMDWIVAGLAIPISMLVWLIGASAIGAEWSHRGITTLLTWEPRRTRVLVAKGIAVCVIAFAWVLSLQVFFTAAMYPAAALRGTMDGVDGAWLADFAGSGLRTASVAALAGMFGFCLATVGRNTAAAFGAGFAYLAIVESLIRTFRSSWVDWLVGDNVALFMMGVREVDHLGHSQATAGLLLFAYGTLLFAVALTIFRRREIV